MKKVIVIYGGESCEHEISVITGVLTLNAIDKSQYEAIPIFVDRKGRWLTGEGLNDLSVYKNQKDKRFNEVVLKPNDKTLYKIKGNKLKPMGEIYCAINCMHGGFGEGGEVCGAIRLSKIPTVASGLFASSLAMDKEFTKIALQGIGVKCLPCVKIKRDSYYLRKQTALRLVQRKLSLPAIVKPASLGSSIGIKVAKTEAELEMAIDLALRFDEKVVVEQMLVGAREINCAVYKKEGRVIPSECEEPISCGDMLTFDEKYKKPTKKTFPAELDDGVASEIKRTSVKVYSRLGFSGVIRIDYLITDGEIYLNEINSIPGSLAYYLFCEGTDEFSEMLSQMIEESVDEQCAKDQSVISFYGGVLDLSSPKIHK